MSKAGAVAKPAADTAADKPPFPEKSSRNTAPATREGGMRGKASVRRGSKRVCLRERRQAEEEACATQGAIAGGDSADGAGAGCPDFVAGTSEPSPRASERLMVRRGNGCGSSVARSSGTTWQRGEPRPGGGKSIESSSATAAGAGRSLSCFVRNSRRCDPRSAGLRKPGMCRRRH